MNTHTTKNYTTDGGDRTVIGGVLEFAEGAEARNFPGAGTMNLGNGLSMDENGNLTVTLTPAENIQAIETTDITRLVAAFNDLLSKLKAAGLMVPDTVEAPDGSDPDQGDGTAPTDGTGADGSDTGGEATGG